jgi:tRNA(fMet)-specific endonuclease VapC
LSYLLDSATLAEVLRAVPSQSLVRRLSQIPPASRFISSVTVTKLLIAARENGTARLMQDVVRLVAAVQVAEFDLSAAQVFARQRSTGVAMASDDLMVAATALSRDFALVTKRIEDFEGIQGLRIEDWTVA